MTKCERAFVETVRVYYEAHGRHDLPWRKTKNPYRILVSEVMLQQTQVERVIPKYKSFLKQFPTVEELASAPLGAVLVAWQGLGYNRRAKLLHECARTVVCDHKGRFPKTHRELVVLPGIGHYTAGAVLAFAFNTPEPVIETNVRSVYLHHFFKNNTDVTDTEILTIVRETLDHANPREWYYALMDYGVYIKKSFGNPNQKSKHYTKQSRFAGSDREIRGAIIKQLTNSDSTKDALNKKLVFSSERIVEQLEKLLTEGLITKTGRVYCLPK